MAEIRNGFIRPQIWYAKREKKMCGIENRLKIAEMQYIDMVFAGEKYVDDQGQIKKEYSVLPFFILDYSLTQNKELKFNMEPYMFKILERMMGPAIMFQRDYEYSCVKSYPLLVDTKNCVKTVTLTIKHQPFTDSSKSKPKASPWYIAINHSTSAVNEAGKVVAKVNGETLFFNLLNDEFMRFVDDTLRCIDLYVQSMGVPLMKMKQNTLAQQQEEFKQQREQKRWGTLG